MQKLIAIRGRLGAVALLGFIAACASSAPAEHAGTSAGAIQGGTDDKTHSYAVGVCGDDIGNCALTCSGALIAPNLVVTARHCVDVSPGGINATCTAADGPDCRTCATAQFGDRLNVQNYSITTDYSMRQSTRGWHRVAKIVTPSDTAMCGNDIALLILKDNVPASEATPVTPDVQIPITNHAVYSTSETAIGYGLSAPPTQNGPDTSGLRRIRQNIVVQCIPNDPTTQLDCYKIDPLYKQVVGVNEFVAGDGTCEGDSGSSAFEQNSFESGNPVSLGVLSRGGVSDDNTTCQGAVYTRLDKHRDFIVATAQEAASAGGYPAPGWTAPIVVSDAGVDSSSAKDSGSSSTGGADLGAACTRDADCRSSYCATPPNASDTGLVCTQVCASDGDCPSGFACGNSPRACFAGLPAQTSNQVQSTGTAQAGCSIGMAGDPTNPLPWAHFAPIIAGGWLARRLGRRTKTAQKTRARTAT